MYLTQTDLEGAYGVVEVFQIVGGDTAILDNALKSMESMINRNLRVRYVVPFTRFPDELKDIALAITWYMLWRRNQMEPGVKEGFETAMIELRNLAKGITTLSSGWETTSIIPGSQSIPGSQRSGASVGIRTLVYDETWINKYRIP